MLENDFEALALAELEKLYSYLNSDNKYQDLDVDCHDGILKITLPNKQEYVVNKHNPSKQIWLSSPKTGGSYFSYDNEPKHFINRNQHSLIEVILKELSYYE